MRRFFFLQNSPVDCFAKPKELTELETGRSQFVRAGVQRVQPFVHGYRECNIPVQVKGGSLAQLSGVSPLSTGYYLTQKAARNMPYIINKQYSYAEGYVTEQSHGGADISSERRSIFLYDKVKDDEIEITVFSRYIDKNTYLKVQYLPHTKYGAIVEIK